MRKEQIDLKKDYYAALGLSPAATVKDVTRAYRKLALKYHPDARGKRGAVGRFHEISEAKEVLTDPKLRAFYDSSRYERSQMDTPTFNGSVDIGDLFSGLHNIFGRRYQRQDPFSSYFSGEWSPQQEFRVQDDIFISHDVARHGGTVSFRTKRTPANCTRCEGTGGEPGHTHICPRCKGERYTFVQRIAGPGVIEEQYILCPLCKGTGLHITKKCKQCGGKGVAHQILAVTVPPGVRDGQVLLLRATRKGLTSDLYLRIRVAGAHESGLGKGWHGESVRHRMAAREKKPAKGKLFGIYEYKGGFYLSNGVNLYRLYEGITNIEKEVELYKTVKASAKLTGYNLKIASKKWIIYDPANGRIIKQGACTLAFFRGIGKFKRELLNFGKDPMKGAGR